MSRILIASAILVFTCFDVQAKKNLSITSDPAGARIEFNGEFIGATPFNNVLKDFLFEGPKYLWSEFLDRPIQMTISKEGYVTKTIVITSGPHRWVNLNNTAEKIFYIISSTNFHVKLDKVGEFMGTNPFSINKTSSEAKQATLGSSSNIGAGNRQKLSTEEVVQSALPAVVTVRTSGGVGSGFFITDGGILVTNRHVVGTSQSVSIITGKGESFQSDSIFVHPTKDLALIKVKEESFPYLKLVDPASANVGSEVIAIGSPGLGGLTLPNTVTRGILSAFRKSENDGVLVQTDATINPGNSGGPLLNTFGEVVGVNTGKIVRPDIAGLNFAIYSSEVLQMLKEHFNYVPVYSTESAKPVASSEKAVIEITSEPTGAEVYIDDVFNSSAPSTVVLMPGEHTLKVRRPGYQDWERRITIDLDASKTINAILQKDDSKAPANRLPEKTAVADETLGTGSKRVPIRPTSISGKSALPRVKPSSINALPKYLESFLPEEATGRVSIIGGFVEVVFTVAETPDIAKIARKYARDYVTAAYNSGLDLRGVKIEILDSSGQPGLSVTLGSNIAYTNWTLLVPNANIDEFIAKMKEVSKRHRAGLGEYKADIAGIWAN